MIITGCFVKWITVEGNDLLRLYLIVNSIETCGVSKAFTLENQVKGALSLSHLFLFLQLRNLKG